MSIIDWVRIIVVDILMARLYPILMGLVKGRMAPLVVSEIGPQRVGITGTDIGKYFYDLG